MAASKTGIYIIRTFVMKELNADERFFVFIAKKVFPIFCNNFLREQHHYLLKSYFKN